MLRGLCRTEQEHKKLDACVAQLRRDGNLNDTSMGFIYELATRPKYADGTVNRHQADYLRQAEDGLGNTCIYSDAVRELH